MIADVPVREIITPSSLDEAAAVMRGAAARGASVAFMGGGTALGFGNPPQRVDLLLKTEKLTRVIEYAPSDQVVTVEAGLTLGALQRLLAAEKQRLAIDPPLAERATIGGLLATNAYGPRRTRYGTLRDVIVGMSLVRADGTVARGGGKVVKNVAGFDLPKLMIGSLGTLGLIATATFRLHPLPERARWHAVSGLALSDVRSVCRAALDRRLEPAAILAVDADGAYALYVLFEGFGAGVESQSLRYQEMLRDLLSGAAAIGEPRDDAGVAALDESARTFGSVRLRISTPPSFAPSLDGLLVPLRAAYQDSRTVLYPAVGATFIGGFPLDAERFAAALSRARAAAEAAGGNLVVVECAEPALRERIELFGTLPNAFGIMERLKARFDPERRLNPGRFVGGL